MSALIVKLISLYQRLLWGENSPLKHTGLFKKPMCVFYPTCSEYSKEAFTKYGFLKGLFLSIRRILRCHPWQKNHLDPLK